MEAKHKIGDKVWYAKFTPNNAVTKSCCVCNGNLEVTLILGNGDHVSLPCDYCGKGFQSPTGVETDYQADSTPERVIIEQVKTEESFGGEKVEYQSGYHIYYADSVFDTYEEALAEGENRKAKWIEEQNTRAEHIKKSVNKTFAWNAGYHLREAKRMEKQIEYHRDRAKLCKERVK